MFLGIEMSEITAAESPNKKNCVIIINLSETSVSGSTKLYNVYICYENLLGSMKSSHQAHNEMKTFKFSYYLVYTYILRIFKIKVCGFSINVKVKFHSIIQKQKFDKKFYAQ